MCVCGRGGGAVLIEKSWSEGKTTYENTAESLKFMPSFTFSKAIGVGIQVIPGHVPVPGLYVSMLYRICNELFPEEIMWKKFHGNKKDKNSLDKHVWVKAI